MGKFLISLGAASIASTLIVLALPAEIFAGAEPAATAAPRATTVKTGVKPAQQQPKAITLPPLQGPF